jgi:hypothetical protein
MRWWTNPARPGLSWEELAYYPPSYFGAGGYFRTGRGRTDATMTAGTEEFRGLSAYCLIAFRTQAMVGVGRNSYYVGQHVTVTFTGAYVQVSEL